jgi:hypothetical protein
LFKGDAALEACLVRDSAHVTQGAVGPHVAKIQLALVTVDDADIDADELGVATYGPSTAQAVLDYKTERQIINFTYQTRPDNIVGKMTIARLDRDLVGKENAPPGANTCRLLLACPCDRPNRPPRLLLGFAIGTGALGAPTDEQIINKALRDSKQTRLRAIAALVSVIRALERRAKLNQPLTPEQMRVFRAAIKWLAMNTVADQISAVAHMQTAINLLSRSFATRNSAGEEPAIKRVSGNFHGLTDAVPDHGIQCGDDFFDPDGPLCRRDVITHELLHFLGVKHGGSALNGPTIRANITTPALALDSADNLAQLVSEITTFGAKTDSCAIAGQ